MNLMSSDPQALLEDLDPEQRLVAEHQAGAMCVLAGAGTGKTRAITYRIAYGVRTGAIDHDSLLALTFTARAAAEMRGRLRELGVGGVQARTFHAAALKQLSFFWPTLVGSPMPSILEHKTSAVVAAASRLGVRLERTEVRDIAAEIEWAKVSLVGIENYADTARKTGRAGVGKFPPERVADLLDAYEVAKKDRGVIDFEDVLLLTAGMMEQRKDIAARVRGQYRSFVVDEYQDVSPLQQYLLQCWLGKRRDLCVVGDIAQTIYSFAGATPKFLTDFTLDFPEATVVHLNRDYRSTPQVVAVANKLLSGAKDGQGRSLEGVVRLLAQQPSGPAVEFHALENDQAEAQWIAEKIRQLHASGTQLANMAILYRTNAQSQVFEDALGKASIGYLVRGGQRFFERTEVRQALKTLRAHAATRSLIISEDDPATAQSLSQTVTSIISTLGWTPEPPQGTGAVREKWDSLQAIISLAIEEEAKGAQLPEFVDHLLERAEAQHVPTVQGVTLATMHASKGLEWEVVFLAGTSEGLMPISLSTTPEGIEEERRLLYVGVTRAQHRLLVSFAKARHEGGRATRKASRFWQGIWPQESIGEASAAKTKSASPSANKTRKARHDAFAQGASKEELERFEMLRAWRSETAKELQVPPYTVFHDTTLISLAEIKPTSLKQLGIIRGIGPAKLERWGSSILALLREGP